MSLALIAAATWDGMTLSLKTDFAIMKPVVIRINK